MGEVSTDDMLVTILRLTSYTTQKVAAAGNEGDGKKKRRMLKGLATITATISRVSMRK